MLSHHVPELGIHVGREFFLILNINDVLGDMGCVTRCCKQHDELQLSGQHFLVAGIRQRDELISQFQKRGLINPTILIDRHAMVPLWIFCNCFVCRHDPINPWISVSGKEKWKAA